MTLPTCESFVLISVIVNDDNRPEEAPTTQALGKHLERLKASNNKRKKGDNDGQEELATPSPKKARNAKNAKTSPSKDVKKGTKDDSGEEKKSNPGRKKSSTGKRAAETMKSEPDGDIKEEDELEQNGFQSPLSLTVEPDPTLNEDLLNLSG